MPKAWILVIADDLTGALEVGAKFAACGLRVRVTVDHSLPQPPSTDVLVVDTETRHVCAEAAFGIVSRIAGIAATFAPKLVYKKTDSTLRGPIGAEFQALQSVFPDRRLIYAPAYPEMGRTVKDGNLHVWGTPLHATEFAGDLLNPVRESNIKRLLGSDAILLLDGESNQEIEQAASMVRQDIPRAMAAGPAALAGALARTLTLIEPAPPQWPEVRTCLVINGSLHPASIEQISIGNASGCFEKCWTLFDEEFSDRGLERASAVGRRVKGLLEQSAFDALLVFGGDTAFGIHAALGAADFDPIGEVLPGVPVARCGNLIWMTKAGGFGSPELLLRLQNILT